MIFKKLIYLLAPAALVAVLDSCRPAAAPLKSDRDSLLQAVGDYLDWEGENGFDGAVLVQIPGHDPLMKAYGHANSEQSLPNTPETAFDIGSITKQFTGAAILRLEMEGKLRVEDSIGRYLEGLVPEKSAITFHQLLTHSSGLPSDIGSDAEVITRDMLIGRINQATLIFQPGSAYHYSHAGYNLLGLLIEYISGTDYESFLEDQLFRPARMRYTGYRLPDWKSTVIAHGYRFCNDWGRPMDSGWLEDGPSWNRRASGGMLSTVQDLYAWHLALLGNDILDAQAKAKYYFPSNPVRINSIQTSGYGWRVIQTPRNTNAIAHNGWNGRFYSDFIRYLDDNVTIILLSNKFREGNQGVPIEVARTIFWKGYRPVLNGKLTVCSDSLPSNRLGQLAGRFLTLLDNGIDKDFTDFAKNCLASHLIGKYGTETLVTRMKDLQKQSGTLKIKQVMITDNQWMRIEVLRLDNSREAYLQLFFDIGEDYRIRGFRFESPEESL